MNQFPDEIHNRTMKDFLELYNKLTHHCFDTCVTNFNYRTLTTEEVQCVSCCSDKYIAFNQRHMLIFMDYQSKKQKAAADAQGGTSTAAGESAGTQVSALASVADKNSELASVADKMMKNDSVTSQSPEAK